MADQVDDLIREIAAKHGIAVARDDPILVLQTINNRLLQDSAKAQQAQLDLYKAELESIALRWQNDAKEKAERILNVSLAASKEAMGQIMQAGAESSVTSVRQQVDAALSQIAGPISHANRIGRLNVAASFITMLTAMVVIWATAH